MRQTALFMNYAKIKCISKSKIQLFFKSRFYLKVHQCIYNHRTTKTNQKYPSVNL